MAKQRTRQGLELTRRLATYSAAVGAGLALSNQAEATIQFDGSDVDFGATYGDAVLSLEGVQKIRLLGYSNTSSSTYFIAAGPVNTMTAGTAAVLSLSFSLVQVPSGDSVDSTPSGSDNWQSGGSPFFSYSWPTDADGAYMGFRFRAAPADDWLYGWAQVQSIGLSDGRLLGWAYEDDGSPIDAGDIGAVPEPSGLALLALGAAGMTTLRRRRQAAVTA